ATRRTGSEPAPGPGRSRRDQLAAAGPGHVVDGQPRRPRNGARRHAGERDHLPVKVRLVGVARLRRHQRGRVAGRQAVGGRVEPDELRRPLRGQAHLGPETGPQALATPAHLGRQLLDPDLPAGGDEPAPGLPDLGVDRPPDLEPPGQRGLGDGEPLLPRAGRLQPLLGAHRVPAPEVLQGDDRAGQRRRGPEHLVGDRGRQAHLQAGDLPPAAPHAAVGQAGDDRAPLAPPAGLVHRVQLAARADVDDDGDRRVRDDPQVDRPRLAVDEAGHADTGQSEGAGRRRDLPGGHRAAGGSSGGHGATLRGRPPIPPRHCSKSAGRTRADAGRAPTSRTGATMTGTLDPHVPALELAAAIRHRELSPVEVVDGYLARVDALDGRLNAFCHLPADEVRATAAAAAAAVVRAASPDDLPPFHGVPLPFKDLVDVAGWPTTAGSAATSRAPAAASDPVVRRLVGAGFLPFGKTTTSEFGTVPFTESDALGTSRNPWDPDRTPGGSSSGAGVAAAAGMAPVAHAADGGGSIRTPASCTGLVGLKPTGGLVTNLTVEDEGLAAHGVVTRTVADTAAVLDVLARHDPAAWWSPPSPARPFAAALDDAPPRGLRVGVLVDPPI